MQIIYETKKNTISSFISDEICVWNIEIARRLMTAGTLYNQHRCIDIKVTQQVLCVQIGCLIQLSI